MSIRARYEGLFEGTDNYTFHMLGCGAIGSSAAMQLIRMGAMSFHLYDSDVVEDVNIGVSQYNLTDIGTPKTRALSDHMEKIEPEADIKMHYGMFESLFYEDNNDIVILGFDSMKSRLMAVETIFKNPTMKIKCIIDGRMGAEHYQQYFIEKPTLAKYMDTWYPDNEGDEEPCNAKATSYCSNMSGSFIANAVRKFITNSPLNSSFSFHFPTMLFQSES